MCVWKSYSYGQFLKHVTDFDRLQTVGQILVNIGNNSQQLAKEAENNKEKNARYFGEIFTPPSGSTPMATNLQVQQKEKGASSWVIYYLLNSLHPT